MWRVQPILKTLGAIFAVMMAASGLFCERYGAQAQTGFSVPVRESEVPGARIVDSIQLYGSSHALVIGIDDYSNGWPPLSNAVADARVIADVLTERGFAVTLRLNPSGADLRQDVEQFFVRVGSDPEARLFIWFAGHGETIGGEGYLVPADAPASSETVDFKLTALPMRRFGEFMRAAQALHVMAVFDSCFSGTVFNTGRNAPPPAITMATARPVRQFLTSGDAGQRVSDDGLFRRLFVDALSGEERADANGDGYLTGSELGMFLGSRVTNLTERAQTPRFGKIRDPDYDKGDYVWAIGFPADASDAGGPENHADQSIVRAAVVPPPAPVPPPGAIQSAGRILKDCMSCPELVVVPPGTFRMGADAADPESDPTERPHHDVSIGYSLAVGRYEVTRSQYSAFVQVTGWDPGEEWEKGCWFVRDSEFAKGAGLHWDQPGFDQHEDHPVACVSYDDAKAYIAWLTDESGKPYRLLSEAEWEYAARAQESASRWWGAAATGACGHANVYDQSGAAANGFSWSDHGCDDGAKFTAPVGAYQPNGFGLFDMLGNVGEWVADCWNDSYQGAPEDGTAWRSGECGERLVRGGSWVDQPSDVRLSERVQLNTDIRYYGVGFRVARPVEP